MWRGLVGNLVFAFLLCFFFFCSAAAMFAFGGRIVPWCAVFAAFRADFPMLSLTEENLCSKSMAGICGFHLRFFFYFFASLM